MFNLIWQLHRDPSNDSAINGDVFACICHSVRKHNLIVRYKDTKVFEYTMHKENYFCSPAHLFFSGGIKTRVPKGSRTLLTCFANMSLYRYRDVVEPDSIEESPPAFQADVPQPPIRKLHCTPVSTRNLFTSFGGSFTP